MDFVSKALWYIETNFEEEFTLDDVATVAGLSKFHLVRAFGTYFGKSVIRYARERRLTEAAKCLADSNDGILDVAIQFGYNSHEAFTRAFKVQFGVTPGSIQKSPFNRSHQPRGASKNDRNTNSRNSRTAHRKWSCDAPCRA